MELCLFREFRSKKVFATKRLNNNVVTTSQSVLHSYSLLRPKKISVLKNDIFLLLRSQKMFSSDYPVMCL